MASGADPAKRTLLDRASANAGKIAAIAGAVSAVIALWPGELWQRTFARPDVAVTQRALVNPPVPSASELQQAPPNGPDLTPQITVTLANDGRKDLRIDRAVVTVDDYAGFTSCSSGSGSGDIGSSPPTTVVLDGKLEPRPSAPVDKIIRAGDTHRFAIKLAQQDRVQGRALYAVRVHLETDHDPIELGRYVVAFPQGWNRLDAESFPISAKSGPLYGPRFTVADTWCFRSQWAALQRILARPGDRSPETKRLSAAERSPGWERFASQSTPERSIAKLLKGDGAIYALQAAAESGDPATKPRVISALAALATKQLDSSPAFAAYLAEALYEATGAPEHRKLVDRARVLADQEQAAAGGDG